MATTHEHERLNEMTNQFKARMEEIRAQKESERETRNIQRIQEILSKPDHREFIELMTILRIYGELGIE